MYKNKQAAWQGSSFSNFNFAGGKNESFIGSNSSRNYLLKQCKNCGSDDNRFSIDSICIRCQQRVEFIVREHPQVLKNKGALAQVYGGRK